MHLRPLHDRLIVQRLDEDSTERIGSATEIQTRVRAIGVGFTGGDLLEPRVLRLTGEEVRPRSRVTRGSIVGAALALGLSGAASAQYLMVVDSSAGARGVHLFNPFDGSVVNEDYIIIGGSGVPKHALQVGIHSCHFAHGFCHELAQVTVGLVISHGIPAIPMWNEKPNDRRAARQVARQQAAKNMVQVGSEPGAPRLDDEVPPACRPGHRGLFAIKPAGLRQQLPHPLLGRETAFELLVKVHRTPVLPQRHRGAAQHVELGLVREIGERPAIEQRAQRRHEIVGVLGHHEHADSLRVVGVEIQRAVDAVLRECRHRGLWIPAAAEPRELHEQAPVEGDLLAAAAAFLGGVAGLLYPAVTAAGYLF